MGERQSRRHRETDREDRQREEDRDSERSSERESFSLPAMLSVYTEHHVTVSPGLLKASVQFGNLGSMSIMRFTRGGSC